MRHCPDAFFIDVLSCRPETQRTSAYASHRTPLPLPRRVAQARCGHSHAFKIRRPQFRAQRPAIPNFQDSIRHLAPPGRETCIHRFVGSRVHALAAYSRRAAASRQLQGRPTRSSRAEPHERDRSPACCFRRRWRASLFQTAIPSNRARSGMAGVAGRCLTLAYPGWTPASPGVGTSVQFDACNQGPSSFLTSPSPSLPSVHLPTRLTVVLAFTITSL